MSTSSTRHVVFTPHEIDAEYLAHPGVCIGDLIEVSPFGQKEPGETYEVILCEGEKQIHLIGIEPYSSTLHARIYQTPLSENSPPEPWRKNADK